MERFVRRENIKRYRKLLREADHGAGRRLIQKLLMEEEQKELAARTSSALTVCSPPVSRTDRMLMADRRFPCEAEAPGRLASTALAEDDSGCVKTPKA